MSSTQIRFDDGAAYERYMGTWSRLAGEQFLNWLAPAPALRWLDIGCGNGAFTEMLAERCAPAALHGIDPSDAQLAHARTRPRLRDAQFHLGDAMSLPFPDKTFDAAVMPLVIFFLPDPAKGVVEMARVIRPGGIAAAYAWDVHGGGFPYQSLHDEIRDMGIDVPMAPSPDASRTDVLQDLWTRAGLKEVETRELTVRRTFANFDDYWTTVRGGPSVSRQLSAMSADQLAQLQDRMRARLSVIGTNPITYSARANAVKGRISLAS